MSTLFGHADHSLYSNGMTFLRRPMVQNINAIDADVVVLGLPFDLATSGRPGARLGPDAIRRASVHLAWEDTKYPWTFPLFERLKVADAGDFTYPVGDPEYFTAQLEMAADQILNGYLSTAKLDGGTNIANNNAGTVVEGKSYTNMEHYWDEGFGYLYGLEPNPEIPAFGGSADVLLNKYLGKSQFAEEQKLIYDAFIMGRAAIVAKNYTVRDAQAKIIQINISKVIGEKAHDYLKSFVEKTNFLN